MMNDQVVLVNENDDEIGLMPKLEAHEKGMLHRAFSVFVLDSAGRLLLQQRAMGKYHSEGLWSNTCCSHPLPGESVADGAARRLMEEMGMQADLRFLYSFIYHAPLANGLTEHEVDHIFVAVTDQLPTINPQEVMDYKYMSPEEVKKDMARHPQEYTEWFKICFDEFCAIVNKPRMHE